MVIGLVSVATLLLGCALQRAYASRLHRGTRAISRRVRLHLLDGNGQPGETFEGLQVGKRPIAGHYVLMAAKHLEAEDRSNALEGRRHEFPKERVLFVQVLA